MDISYLICPFVKLMFIWVVSTLLLLRIILLCTLPYTFLIYKSSLSWACTQTWQIYIQQFQELSSWFPQLLQHFTVSPTTMYECSNCSPFSTALVIIQPYVIMITYLIMVLICISQGFPGGSVGKETACNAGDARVVCSLPGSGRVSGEGHGNPLQYSCLENPMDRGLWWAIVHGVKKSRTQLKRLSTQHAVTNTFEYLFM